MEGSRGAVKHVLLAKFKDEVPAERIEELIRAYANLVSLTPHMKSFHWYFLCHLSGCSCYICHPLTMPSNAIFHLMNDASNKGKDVSRKNKHQGFTHVFESTFDSTDDIAEYYDHPAHVEFANEILPAFDKYIVVDYEPSTINC